MRLSFDRHIVKLFLLSLPVQHVLCAPAISGIVLSQDVSDEPQRTSSSEIIQQPLDILSPHSQHDEVSAFPSRSYSTLLARRLLALSSTGILTTVFPKNISDIPVYGRTPAEVASISIGLPEYIADCEEDGNPTIIALGVSTSTKNAEYGDETSSGRNVSLSVSWWEEYEKIVGREPWSKANLPRLSLLGCMEYIEEGDVEEKEIERCFERVHRDSRLWAPGSKNAAHLGKWARIVVEDAYWIGGFGDANYIGWLDLEEWRKAGDKWKDVRLRGEKP